MWTPVASVVILFVSLQILSQLYCMPSIVPVLWAEIVLLVLVDELAPVGFLLICPEVAPAAAAVPTVEVVRGGVCWVFLMATCVSPPFCVSPSPTFLTPSFPLSFMPSMGLPIRGEQLRP